MVFSGFRNRLHKMIKLLIITKVQTYKIASNRIMKRLQALLR